MSVYMRKPPLPLKYHSPMHAGKWSHCPFSRQTNAGDDAPPKTKPSLHFKRATSPSVKVELVGINIPLVKLGTSQVTAEKRNEE